LAISYAIENEDTRAQAWKGIRETLIISVRPYEFTIRSDSIRLKRSSEASFLSTATSSMCLFSSVHKAMSECQSLCKDH
jgi:hypothetical protein